jgi:alpha,alpha-trehalase
VKNYEAVLEHIESYWHRLIRSTPQDEGTLIGLPRPYLVPSENAIFRELFYWDSYFTAFGVLDSPLEGLVVDITENLARLFHRFGVIPNGSRYYFLSRSQPPFFTRLALLALTVKEKRGDADTKAWLTEMTRVAELEHETVWLGTQHPHHRLMHAGLSRYFDINYLDALASCESGWDHSTRCDERWLEHLPVDLNAILHARELDLARMQEHLGNLEAARKWQARAATRAETMNALLWDEAAGFYFDFDFQAGQRNPHPSLAGFYPLWSGLASPEQAERVVHEWLPRFERPGGLLTTLEVRAGCQWAAPNGWAPLHWLVVAGLERYGFHADATRVMRAWCDNNALVFEKTGAMWEKYNVEHVGVEGEGGLYGALEGFGWTNGVFRDFARRLE